MRALLCALGFFCLAIGGVGLVVPILPSTPLFLLAAFCFAKGSARVNNWFLSTKLYHNHLKSYAEKRGMAVKTKVAIMLSVTAILTLAFIFMKGIIAGQVVLIVVWVFHIIYFIFRVKTVTAEAKCEATSRTKKIL